MHTPYSYKPDAFDRFIHKTLDGGLPMFILVVSLVLGALALWLTAREEEPQIVVPMVDVSVQAPGLSAQQIERQVTTPLEKLLAQINGVEHIYSTSSPGRAMVTLRFYVGEDRENAILNTYNKLYSNSDQVPASVSQWVVKPVEIDDVPMVMLGLWSDNPARYDDFELRRLAEEMAIQLQAIPNTNQVQVIGGRPRQVQVQVDAQALAARGTTPLDIVNAIKASNQQLPAGAVSFNNQAIVLEVGQFLPDAQALGELVVNVVDGSPVYLKEVAHISDGPALATSYSWLALGADNPDQARYPADYPMVTLAVAKQKGSNAVWVAEDVHELVARLKSELLPAEVHVEVLRDYGETANEKINELTDGLVFAVITVVVFIGLFLGWRPAIVVALAIPLCYGAALAINMVSGYTINRVTLFALILALGLLVDDPITGIDNIERFHRSRRFNAKDGVVAAIKEIRGPLIMASLTIILAFVPLGFITGMMGPYMAPMALNVPVTIILSTIISFFVTPWLAYKFFVSRTQPVSHPSEEGEGHGHLYRRLLTPLLAERRRIRWFLIGVLVLFVAAAMLPVMRLVPLKLLPFDNKNELQVLVDMPEGSTLEATQAVLRQVQTEVLRLPEVRSVAAYVGVASPIDFNGLVRKYYLRQAPYYADLRITLAEKKRRQHQSHAILLRLRPLLAELQSRLPEGTRIKPVEVPPGPPVLSTLVAEIYGSTGTAYSEQQAAAATVMARLGREPGVADVDSYIEADQPRQRFVPNQQKAALSGIAASDIAQTLAMANNGVVAAYLQQPTEVNPTAIEVRLPEAQRGSERDLQQLSVRGQQGIVREHRGQGLEPAPQPLVPLAELGAFVDLPGETSIYHKDLQPVVYVTADTAGRPPAEIIADVSSDLGEPALRAGASPRPLAERSFLRMGGGDGWSLPEGVRVNWSGEGEWLITVDVFRDMGIAFAAALTGIFLVLRLQTKSTALALIIMSAIPLTIIGIMPGFWLLNLIGERTVAGSPDPVLFTATAMIGMIALAGIVVRNSLILVEFINNALADGLAMTEALIRAGTTRMRPILLTAGTALLGNLVIILDPVFGGLAWAIIFGLIASTLFTLFVVPSVYYLVFANHPPVRSHNDTETQTPA